MQQNGSDSSCSDLDSDSEALSRPERLAALRGTTLLSHCPANESLDRLARLAQRILQVPLALVSLVEQDRQFFPGAAGLPEPMASVRQTPLNYSFCRHVVVSRDVVAIADTREDDRVCNNPAIAQFQALAYLGVPLVTRDGHVLGAFCCIDTSPRRWTSEEIGTLSELAQPVITEIELRSAVLEAERHVGEAELQHAISRVLVEAPTLEDAGSAVLETIGQAMGWKLGLLWNVERHHRELRLRCINTWQDSRVGLYVEPHVEPAVSAAFTPVGAALALGQGLPGRVWSQAEPIWLADFLRHDDDAAAAVAATFPRLQAAARHGLHGALAFPVIGGEGGVLGVLEFFSDQVRPPDKQMLRTLTVIGRQLGQYVERRRAERELNNSQMRRAAILETALDCIITIDEAGRVVEWNPAAERVFGYKRSEALGQEMAQLIVPPAFRERHRQGLAHYLATGEGPVLDRRFEITALRADGTEFPVELAITPIPVDGPPMFTGYVRDLTERKQLETLRDDLTHMIVHDLRTPLTAILSGMQTLEMAGGLQAHQQEFVTMAVSGGRTLLSMINDLLDISKMEADSLQLDYTDIEVRDLIGRALAQISALAAQAGITLVTDIAPEMPLVPGDEDKLRRTLVNLVGNAVKFTPSGGTVTVTARSEPVHNQIIVSVRDTGEGIPQDAIGRIFDKFGQVESRKAGRMMSTGLGLTFCKMAVEAHGGRIWVESQLGKGSTFSFVVPLIRSSDALR
jgi:PAS domain S-box-containing protein